jgi:hypothetical protein
VSLRADERALRLGDRTVGVLGPMSSSFTLAWLASHRGRLRTALLGGHRLSILIVYDRHGRKRVQRSDADVDAIRQIALGSERPS